MGIDFAGVVKNLRQSFAAHLKFGSGAAPAAPKPILRHLSAEQKRFFHENGYLVLERYFTAPQIEGLKRRMDELWRIRRDGSPLVIDARFGMPGAQRMYFREAEDEVRDFPYKVSDLHLEEPLVQDFSTDARLVAALEDLLGARPTVCNTLLFEWGSQQDLHFDTFYMPSKTPNMMAATWIALDRVTETNGPLIYYPGSHLIEPYRFSHGGIEANFAEMAGADAHIQRIIREHGLKELRFLPQPGDVLIWHAQLLHGGSPIVNPKETRTSLVTHYFTVTDFPDPAASIDLGGGRLIIRKGHQRVVDAKVWAELEAFVKTLETPAEDLAAVPDGFDPKLYLARNQDVLEQRIDPYTHYRQTGRAEGRLW